MTSRTSIARQIPAVRVQQWLPGWSSIKWNPSEHRSQPRRWFYQFSIPATHLKALSGIHARTTKARQRGADDLGIQRRHEPERSDEIARFVEFGYPWSDLSASRRASDEYNDLRKPGWLPTAIVVNVLTRDDRRNGRRVHPDDIVEVVAGADSRATVNLPNGFSGRDWRPKELPPIEVIDGQHRLWAFESKSLPDDFELPVVAFDGLDISWQAYLFYTINIKPKKINPSLAFDLYPLLRTEDWLQKFEGHAIYRETRAQELVDILWSHPKSPWHKRINMLGEPGTKGLMVSQAAWIRSLLATYIKPWETRGARLGGLFGAPVGKDKTTPGWTRAEQAAILIYIGCELKDKIAASAHPWAKALRLQERPKGSSPTGDWAFLGPNSLLNQDQGIRVLLQVTNDVVYKAFDDIDLLEWGGASQDGSDEFAVSDALKSLNKLHAFRSLTSTLMTELARYDWRASDAPGLSAEQALLKAAFRGSGGYRELREHVFSFLAQGKTSISKIANSLLKSRVN